LPLSALETVLGMQAQDDGTLWLRTNRRILQLKGKSEIAWEVGGKLPGTRTESLWVDSDGVAWVGTNRALVTITPGNQVSPGNESIGINSILSIAGDREGDIWIGTETAGLHVLRPQQFHTMPALSDQVITSVVQAEDGTVWMGTREDGLRRYRSGTIDRPQQSSKLASQIILALAPGLHGDLWVGTPDGLNHIEGDRVSTLGSANGLPDDFVRSLLRDDDGSIWVGTRRGLAHWKDNRVVETITSANGLRSDLIGALLRTSPAPGASEGSGGDLWIATLQGLSRLHDGQITTYTTADGLAGNVITSLAQDATGAVWIGARDGGLTRYADGRFTAFRQPELPPEVESLALDRLGSLWLASRRGVARVPLSGLTQCAVHSPCSLSVSQYGYSNGLPSEEVSASGHPAVWRTTKGELWFATRKGVAIIDPAHLRETPAKFPVAIEHFVVDDVEQPGSSSNLSIAPGHASFNIQYVGLSYSAPSRVRYRYRLEGIDRHWIDAGARRTAYYTNLPPGAYRFRVEAVVNGGDWGANAAGFRFRVLPPFYRRLWFYLLCALLLGAIMYLAYRLRLRQLNSQFNAVLAERNRIAREIHDTLAQGFVGISIHLELVAHALSTADVPAAERQIQDTKKLVRESLADARQSIWELRTIAAQDSLPTRLAKVVEVAAQRGAVAKLDVTGTYRELSPTIEGEILRISQEALANATRHANASTVLVGLRYGPEQLVLTIKDDGKGFSIADVPASGNHFGLQGMRERAAHIGATIEMNSTLGEGTQITLTAKI
jgi:signal transduction histidine kinase